MDGKAAFQFRDHAPGPQEGGVFGHAIGPLRHLEESVAGRPVGLVQFGGESGDVAHAVGRIVPGFVADQGPVQKLRCRVAGEEF